MSEESNNQITELVIGEFTFARCSMGTLWIHKEDGEWMQCNDETESSLESILEQWWEANF